MPPPPLGFVARTSLLVGGLFMTAASVRAQDPGSQEATPDQLIARSRAAIEAEEYHPAIATLALVFSQHPRRSDAARLLARTHHLANQHERALAVLEQALRFLSGNLASRYTRHIFIKALR